MASKSGQYGGPFDTARLQVETLRSGNIQATLLTGTLRNDRPASYGETKASYRFIEVSRVFPSRGFTSLYSFRFLLEQWRQLKRADVVHISFSRELVPVTSLLLCRALRVPFVLQPHGMLTARTSSAHRLFDAFLRIFLPRKVHWIALTKGEAHKLKKWMGGRNAEYTIIGNPVDTSDLNLCELRIQERDFEALFLARLHPRKRVRDFVAAAELSLAEGGHLKYVVIGPDEGDLEFVLDQVKKLPNLSYGGVLEGTEVARRVASSAVFILPSVAEPWGNVLATAAEVGTPIIVSESAELAQQVREQELGVVVPDFRPDLLMQAAAFLASEPRSRWSNTSGIAPSRDAIESALMSAYASVKHG